MKLAQVTFYRLLWIFFYNSKHYFYMIRAPLLFSVCENEKHQRSPNGKQGVPHRPSSTLQWV